MRGVDESQEGKKGSEVEEGVKEKGKHKEETDEIRRRQKKVK